MLHIRPATPADADAAVPLLLASSPALIEATFGAAAPAVVRRDFLRGKGIFGYSHQLVGVAPDGQVVATMTAYRGGTYRRLSLHTLRSAAVLGPRRLVAVLRRMLAMADLFTPAGGDSLFLANLCVTPDHRDRGYGSTLLEHAREAALSRALPAVELDVSYGNDGARRLYERLGFVMIAERPAAAGSALDGFRRMRRLTAAA
jgi:ribosomal protein S18 acetylase RimI-like enzyme